MRRAGVTIAFSVLLLGGAAVVIFPRAWDAAKLVALRGDPAALVDHELSNLRASDYDRAVASALAAGDEDLAVSLVDLSERESVAIDPALRRQVDDAAAAADRRAPLDVLDGFLSGEAANGAELAGSIGADLTGFGDLRDLYRQAENHLAGEPVDQMTVALAALGLTLTGATVYSLGAAMPAKAGASTLKAAHRAGRLSAPLRRHVAVLAREAVDTGALADLGRAVRSFSPTQARVAAAGIVRPAQAKALRQLGGDVATIGRNAGYRGTLDVLARADSAADVGRFAKVSARFGTATRGALALAGTAAITVASMALTATSWLFAALLWGIAAVSLLSRLVSMAAGAAARLCSMAVRGSYRAASTLWRPARAAAA